MTIEITFNFCDDSTKKEDGRESHTYIVRLLELKKNR